MKNKTITKRKRSILKIFGFQQCIRKIAYRSAEEAQTMSSKYKQRIYECDVCKWYHLTSH